MANKVIIGLTGELASGKDTAAAYLQEKYRAEKVAFSAPLKDVLTRLALPHTRDSLIKLSEILRGTFGDDLLSKVVASDVAASQTAVVVVDGIRRMSDLDYLRDLPGFALVEIFAEPRVRYERLIQRAEKADDKTKTYEQFLADHERSTELSIREVAATATNQLDNNDDLPALYRQIDVLMNQLTSN